MTTRVKLEPIYILHRKQFRESSYIVDILSENYGKIRAITRLNTKHKKALIQPFTPIYASWTIKNELATLQEIEARTLAPMLSGEKIMCGFYINEITMKTTTFHDPAPKLFEAYNTALYNLAKSENVAIELRIFEKNLLDEIGYGIPFAELINSDEKFPWYTYSGQYGFIGSHTQCRFSIAYNTLYDLYNNSIASVSAARECKILLQTALQPVIKKFDIKTRLCWATNTSEGK